MRNGFERLGRAGVLEHLDLDGVDDHGRSVKILKLKQRAGLERLLKQIADLVQGQANFDHFPATESYARHRVSLGLPSLAHRAQHVKPHVVWYGTKGLPASGN